MFSERSHKTASAFERSAQALALSVGFAAASLPALGKAPPTGRQEPTPITAAAPNPLESATLPTLAQVLSPSPTVRAKTESAALPSVEADQSPGISKNLLGAVSGTFSLMAMALYYVQIRRKETAVSIPAIALQSTNDLLLCGSALVTHQGWGAVVTAATFGLLGFECLRVAFKGNPQTRFERKDYYCAAGCLAGWSALIASWSPAAAGVLGKETLAIAASWIGTATYVLASIPMMKAMLERPKPDEVRPPSDHRVRDMLRISSSYICGTTALALAVATVPTFTIATWPQPVALLINNILLTSFIAVWGARRVTGKHNSVPN